jgi:hypothetical protein
MSGVTLLLQKTIPISPPPPTPPAEGEELICRCDFFCEYTEKVFAHDSGDGVRNDFTDFLFRKITPTDSIVIELWRYDKKVATITDDTYGIYYDDFAAQPLYIGWVADWTKIYDAFTGGQYRVKVVSVILGQSETFESRKFMLSEFDQVSADGTVKIVSYQSGNIESSQFDYTGLIEGGWMSSIRFDGEFGKMSPALERDVYLDLSYREIQNRDEIIRQYSLEVKGVTEEIFNRFATMDILGNSIEISSFKIFQTKKYEKFPVVGESFDEQNYMPDGLMNFGMTFSDRQKNINKRNF